MLLQETERVNKSDVEQLVAEYASKYDPLIVFEEAAEIARAKKATIEQWSSRGYFDRFKTKSGKRVLLRRDDFVRFVLEGNKCRQS